jgi:hypothetical protein
LSTPHVRSKQYSSDPFAGADNDELQWQNRLQVEIALPCDIALVPRPRQTFQGKTEQIGRNSAVILLDSDQPASEWPRAGDTITANCTLPVDGRSRYSMIQCHGTVTRVLITETGAPRLEVRVEQLKFRGAKAGGRKPRVRRQAPGSSEWM